MLRALVAIPALGLLAAACTSQPTTTTPEPDPLAPLLTAARTDAATAQAAATAFPGYAATFGVVAALRATHATALATEIARAAGTTSSTPATPASTTATSGATSAGLASTESATMSNLISRLRTAQSQAGTLVPTVPSYRAGLVGSVSAGCASMVEALGG